MFDPVALLVMLLTWYPVVSVDALRRAKAERAEYFGGGELFGSKGEKLRLPDGRVFDCISGTSGPAPAWWVGEVTGEGPGGDDRYPLEAGPLRLIAADAWTAPTPARDFETLAGEIVRELAGAEDQLAAPEGTIATVADPGPFEDDTGAALWELGEAGGASREELDTIDAEAPIHDTITGDGVIDAQAGDWGALEPGEIPEAPTPQPLPERPDDDEDPKQPIPPHPQPEA